MGFNQTSIFSSALEVLTAKLRPKVYELGFFKN